MAMRNPHVRPITREVPAGAQTQLQLILDSVLIIAETLLGGAGMVASRLLLAQRQAPWKTFGFEGEEGDNGDNGGGDAGGDLGGLF